MTGKEQAMYWMSFNPHFPRDQGSSVSGMIPMSQADSSLFSVCSDQGITVTGIPGKENLGRAPMATSLALN
jgi:hypothetical protein